MGDRSTAPRGSVACPVVATETRSRSSAARPLHTVTARSRTLAPLLGGTVCTAIVLWLCFASGGYFATSYVPAGAVAFVALALLLAVVRPAPRLSRSARVALGALAGLTAWTGLSAFWSPTPDAAIAAMQRDAVHLGIFALAVVTVGSGRYARHVMWGVLGAMTIVVIAALFSRLYPELVSSPGLDESFNYRLGFPFSYWNALGTVASMTAVLSFGLAADPRSFWLLRALCAGITVVAVTTMYLSLSRGAWLALIIGGVVLIALSANRGSFVLTALPIGLGAALAVGRAASYPGLIDAPDAGMGQAAAGSAFGAQLWVIVGLVCLAQGLIAAGRASTSLMETVDLAAKKLALPALGVLIVLLVAGYAIRAADAEGTTAKALNDSQDFVSRQWDDFLKPATPAKVGSGEPLSSRLGSANGSRSDLYRVALDGFGDSPVWGQGGGSWNVGWVRERPFAEGAQNAHSLPLETMYESGIIGVALLIAFLAAPMTAAVRRRLRPGGLSRSQVAAVGASASVWIAHSAIDWDWQQSGLTAIALVLLATLLPYGRAREGRSRRVAT